MDKQKIVKNFSQYAGYYDYYCYIQNKCAVKLLRILDKDKNFLKILEPGCGTGNYTLLLKKRFPSSQITAFDISPEMIEIAQNKIKKSVKDNSINFYIKDAEKIKFKEQFDLITSNAVFQWIEDIKSLFEKYKNLLTDRGVFTFSIFGPETFKELQTSLYLYDKKLQINSSGFKNKEEIYTILKSIFDKVYIKEESVQVKYLFFPDLLQAIKYTGTRGDINTNIFWTKEILNNIGKIYNNTFGEIVATYQVFFCKIIK
jgi:malonyl-CoA O-methyltransferase